MKLKQLLLLSLLAAAPAAPPIGQPSFDLVATNGEAGIGSFAIYGISADGGVIAGLATSASGSHLVGWKWSQTGGLEVLPPPAIDPSGYEYGYFASGVSADGSVISGTAYNSDLTARTALLWQNGVPVTLQSIAAVPPSTDAHGISGDGLTVVGEYFPPIGSTAPFKWTAAGGFQPLGDLSGEMLVASYDGAVVVGDGNDMGRAIELQWTAGAGTITASELPSDVDTYGSAVSSNGRYVAGGLGAPTYGGWRIDLVTHAIDFFGDEITPRSVSDDGVVVGVAFGAALGSETFIWDPTNGFRSLEVVLQANYGFIPAGIVFDDATMTADGRHIAVRAHGVQAPYDQPSYVFVATLTNTVLGASSAVSFAGGATTPGGASIQFSSITGAGETSVAVSATGPVPPAGFSLTPPDTYYNISTTATFSGAITVCIGYAESASESDFRMLHYEGGSWVDVTSTLDTGANTICGSVTSLSPFIVGAFGAGTALSALGPAKVWIGLANSDDAGIRFDVRAEVYRNGTELVGSGELTSVSGGSSGFGNAHENSVGLTPIAGAQFFPGDALSIRLLVRNSCTGSGKNSGRARLWLNDGVADTRFGATIGTAATRYLLRDFSLGNGSGQGPKVSIDVQAGAKCSTFKSLGVWATTIQ